MDLEVLIYIILGVGYFVVQVIRARKKGQAENQPADVDPFPERSPAEQEGQGKKQKAGWEEFMEHWEQEMTGQKRSESPAQNFTEPKPEPVPVVEVKPVQPQYVNLEKTARSERMKSYKSQIFQIDDEDNDFDFDPREAFKMKILLERPNY